MIKAIKIKNFKSLKRISLDLSALNLLFGLNGMGKSSVIQSLLLLRQSFWSNYRNHLSDLHINGELIELGTARDILCQDREDDDLEFILIAEGDSMTGCTYSGSFIGGVGNIISGHVQTKDADKLYRESVFSNGFVYLSAEHIGPRRDYKTNGWNPKGINPFGKQGEYTVPYLSINADKKHIPAELCLDNGKTDLLIDQVSAWMSVISPGIKLMPEYNVNEASAKLRVGYEGSRLTSDGYMPINVGFGIPYVLPVITSLLVADKGDMIIIENPESHLHPRGQAQVARLISLAANNGVQIICESHSDHIINGVRTAIKRGELDNHCTRIMYFEKDEEQNSKVTEISVDRRGNLDQFPDGFLDEWGLLMSELIME